MTSSNGREPQKPETLEQYLDRRIPELHQMGKPPLRKTGTIGQQVAAVYKSAKRGPYNGRTARRIAEAEFYARQR